MLDYFFEPFVLQHNRHLLGIIDKQLGIPEGGRGPWGADSVGRVRLTTEDIMALDTRIVDLLKQLPADAPMNLGSYVDPRHLSWEGGGRWRLRSPPEIRCSMKLDLGLGAPRGTSMAVLSRAVRGRAEETEPGARRRRMRLCIELRAHRVDVACLQGVDPEGTGKDLAEVYWGLGYGYVAARGPDGKANSIFWDQSRWTCLNSYKHPRGSMAAVDLLPRGNSGMVPNSIVRVACLRPTLPECCHDAWLDAILLSPRQLVACADLAGLGGAEGAVLMPGLTGLASAMVEATGEELAAPLPPGDKGQHLRQLWHPGVVLHRGVAVSSVLSGHTEGYLTTMSDDDVDRQFPGGSLPIVAKFHC